MNIRLFLALLLSQVTQTVAELQYCTANQKLGTDFCFTLASFHNASSTRNDIFIHTSIKFKNRTGWSAFGIGEGMARALMFVFYPGASETDATVSLRTTKSHNAPTVVERGPEYRVLETNIQNEYYDISLVCYGCDMWRGNTLDTSSHQQPFIYAAQTSQIIQSADKSHEIQYHSEYKKFHLDMTLSHVDQPAVARLVPNGRKSIGLGGLKSESDKTTSNKDWANAHGLAMILTFSVIIPIAVACLRSGMSKAFMVHLVLQIVAVIIAFCSALLALAKSWGNPKLFIDHDVKEHFIIGVVVIGVLLLQPALGWYHHVLYKKHGKTLVSAFHVWLGRALIVVAWVNTAVGIRIGQFDSTFTNAWLVTVGVAVLVMAWASKIYSRAKSLRLPEYDKYIEGYRALEVAENC